MTLRDPSPKKTHRCKEAHEKTLASYILRDIRTMRRHYLTLRTTQIQDTHTPGAGGDAEQQELSLTAGGAAKCCSHFGRQFDDFL